MTLFKTFLLSVVLIAVSTFSLISHADYPDPLFVLDSANITELPKNFRTSSSAITDVGQMNITGLSDLHILGSGQFSSLMLEKVIQYLAVPRVTIIDLRQESHGFLNDSGVSWYSPKNAVNAGKSDEQIKKNETKRLNVLSDLDKVKVYEIIDKTENDAVEEATSSEYPVEEVMSEADMASHYGLGYERLYVADHHAPKAGEVDKFIKILKKLPNDEWIYFHCKAGEGRTTTFMAMYDMMRNAKSVSLDDIIARQAGIGGKDLKDLPDPSDYKYPLAVERLIFLKRFYEYARNNKDGFETSWTKWIASH